MAGILDSLSIEGFKSIREMRDLPLKNINVLIGPNGVGKSNFIGFFRLLRAMIDEGLQLFVRTQGGADAFLHLGPKFTEQIVGKMRFGDNGYDFSLVPSIDGSSLIIESELVSFNSGIYPPAVHRIGSGLLEAQIRKLKDRPALKGGRGMEGYVFDSVSSWVVYHFHDTSESSSIRRAGKIAENDSLQADGGNLAAYLYRLRHTHPNDYRQIVEVIQLAAPFFRDFNLRPNPLNPDYIQLEWFQLGSDYVLLPSQLSDGTLRFICLAVALLQPDRPSTLLFDEPELGLHPYALVLLGRLFRQATISPLGWPNQQVIVSTQSPLLLNEFEPEEVIVVERAGGQSEFRRLNSEDLSEWLTEYTLGELWQKNVLGARPHSESPLAMNEVWR
jgi:predicted ATPase